MSFRLPARKLLLGIALGALPLLFTAPAGAATSCNYTNLHPVFSPWLDLAQYTPFPGSDFEHGASGWSWGGQAGVVTGDGNVALATGNHAVNIPGGGTAKSPWLCVNVTTPSMRFFVRRTSGTGALRVQGVLNGPYGKVSSL